MALCLSTSTPLCRGDKQVSGSKGHRRPCCFKCKEANYIYLFIYWKVKEILAICNPTPYRMPKEHCIEFSAVFLCSAGFLHIYQQLIQTQPENQCCEVTWALRRAPQRLGSPGVGHPPLRFGSHRVPYLMLSFPSAHGDAELGQGSPACTRRSPRAPLSSSCFYFYQEAWGGGGQGHPMLSLSLD